MKKTYFLFFVLVMIAAVALGGEKNRPGHIYDYSIFDVKHFGAVGDGIANDAPAIQRAIDTASYYGGGTIWLPIGNFRLAAPLIPKSNIIIKGAGLGAVLMATTYITSAIGQPTSDLINFTVEDLTIEGGVIEEGIFPRRHRNYTPSFTSAIAMNGSRRPGGAYPRISNIVVKNCKILKVRGLPVFFQGVSDKVTVKDSYFENCLDPGFTWCESVMFISNVVKKGADNGVSVSRECKKAVISNNIFEDNAHWGIWCSGFVDPVSESSEPGPDAFTITGNVIRRSGMGGIALVNGPRYGTITGNTIDTVFNGATDRQSKVQGRGIMISAFAPGGVITKEAQQIVISNNLLRNIARGGISLSGASDILISGNSFIDIGATDTISTKVNFNCGIYTDDYGIVGAGLNRIGVVGNSFVDTRNTPFSNYPYSYAIKMSTNSYQKNNTMIGFRQPLGEKLTVGGDEDPDQSIAINARSGVLRELLFQTAGLRRWDIRVNNVPESGSQTGSDFAIIRRNDPGTVAGYPLIITRSDGSVRFVEASGKLGFFGQTPVSKYAAIPNTAGLSLANLEQEVNKLKELLRTYGLLNL